MSDRITVSGPDDQLSIYRNEADEMECSMSAYMKMMTNAGRRELGYATLDEPNTEDVLDVLQLRIRELLASEGPLADHEVKDRLLEELRTEVTEALNELQDQGKIEYDFEAGGIKYVG